MDYAQTFVMDPIIARTKYHESNLGIEKVEVFNNKCTKVTFNDGSFETTVVQGEDKFDLETGISMCVAYHAVGGKNRFYKAVRGGIHTYKQALIEAKKKKNEEEAWKQRKAKERANNEARKKRREEREVQLMTRAFAQALAQNSASDDVTFVSETDESLK